MVNTFVIAAEEGAAGLAEGGFWADTAGVMLLTPFLAFLAIIAVGKRMKYQGGELAVASMAVNTVWASVLFIQNMSHGESSEVTFTIGSIGSGLDFELGWMVDGLSIMMYFLISLVGLIVFVYAIGYMHGDVRVTWFFAAFSLFAGSMLLLVGAPNLVQLIIGWEGVGLASYLLIGHYWEDQENVDAGNKAFLTNKVADVGLVLGAIIVAMAVGDFSFAALSEASLAHDPTLSAVAVTGGFLLFFGAMGKSAQFPLHIWLPDAMAGPTPVSALMHAATMVTGGIYLMARTFPLYQNLAEEIRPWMIGIGAITLFAIGLLALVADDIKKVLAYSTVSQLGYMMTAVAAGGYTAGLFHLFTHAFFKGLLFLGAGSVIHAVHSNNMSDMGGLRKYMPRTYATFVIASLALAGVIPFAGFWSKDEILATLDFEGYMLVFWIAVGGAFITAFYMTRAVALTFHGEYKGEGHPHESPAVMTGPLIALAIPSALVGFLNIPGVELPFIGNFTDWLAVRVVPMGDHHPEGIAWNLAIIGLIAAAAGIALGWIIYSRDADSQAARDRLEVPIFYPLFRRKYFMDDIALGMVGATKGPLARLVDWTNTYIIDGIINLVGGVVLALGRFVYGGVDQRGVEGVFNGLTAGVDGLGSAMRRLQTGKVQQYAAGFLSGALVLVIVLMFLR